MARADAECRDVRAGVDRGFLASESVAASSRCVLHPRLQGDTVNHFERRTSLRAALFITLSLIEGVLATAPAHAFWVVNFGPAGTLPAGKIAFAAGIGGQAVFAGDPQKSN